MTGLLLKCLHECCSGETHLKADSASPKEACLSLLHLHDTHSIDTENKQNLNSQKEACVWCSASHEGIIHRNLSVRNKAHCQRLWEEICGQNCFREASSPDRHRNECQFSRILGCWAPQSLLVASCSSAVFSGALPRKELSVSNRRSWSDTKSHTSSTGKQSHTIFFLHSGTKPSLCKEEYFIWGEGQDGRCSRHTTILPISHMAKTLNLTNPAFLNTICFYKWEAI